MKFKLVTIQNYNNKKYNISNDVAQIIMKKEERENKKTLKTCWNSNYNNINTIKTILIKTLKNIVKVTWMYYTYYLKMVGDLLAFNDKYGSFTFYVSINLSCRNLFNSTNNIIIKVLMRILIFFSFLL